MEPRPVFFTGGSALRELSSEFARQKLPSIHLVTTFDSGGSTAALRNALAIPAVGDLRNRLLALADRDKTPSEVLDFCNFRLPRDISREDALGMLCKTAETHPAWQAMPYEYSTILQKNLRYFLKRMPSSFDARGASMGNLMLSGSYLENCKNFEPALSLFSTLFHIRGKVIPIVNSSLHLGALLENGDYVVGQHLFRNLPAAVRRLFLTVHQSEKALEPGVEPLECNPPINPRSRDSIADAALVCYPMGSFYSSLLANLLPAGCGQSIAKSGAFKVFIPNTGTDPEMHGLTILDQAKLIVETLRRDVPDAPVGKLLNYILVDREHGQYPGGTVDNMLSGLKDMGIKLLNRPVVKQENPNKHSPEAVLASIHELSHGRNL